jgi:DNA (cytosine-5)-methyltransferase 1
VAGLRNSLDDARGNLSLTFVGIANAIDHVRFVRRDAPGIIFWENVPGVLSTKDNAFGCFLGALAGEDDPIIPSGEKWTNAGCVYGPQRTVAWRVLDAQYFGVAQRRRRVFVVASARADFNPAAVLFEFDGVRRDIAPSRQAGQAIAPCVTNGPPFSRTGNERVEAEAMVVQKKWPAELASTLDTTFGTKQGLEDQHVNAGCPLFVPAQTFSIPAIGHIVKDDVASTMTRHTGSGSEETQNPAFVAQPIPINSMNALRSADADPTTGCGIGEAGEAMFTITKGHSHAVAQPTYGIPGNWIGRKPENGGNAVEPMHDVAPCLTKTDRHGVAQPIGCFKGGQGSAAGGIGYDEHIAPTLSAADSGSNRTPALMQGMAVRRLTPVECERLQGFPDGYTNIPWRKKDESPDGPRYKALGNSWAVPVVRWIGHRIQQEINK